MKISAKHLWILLYPLNRMEKFRYYFPEEKEMSIIGGKFLFHF